MRRLGGELSREQNVRFSNQFLTLLVFCTCHNNFFSYTVPPVFCPVIGSNDCKQRIKEVACTYIRNTAGGAIPEPCRDIS